MYVDHIHIRQKRPSTSASSRDDRKATLLVNLSPGRQSRVPRHPAARKALRAAAAARHRQPWLSRSQTKHPAQQAPNPLPSVTLVTPRDADKPYTGATSHGRTLAYCRRTTERLGTGAHPRRELRSIRPRGHGTRPCPEFDAMHERYCGDLLNGVCAPRRGRMLAFQVRRSATWVTRPWHSGAALFHAHVVARHYRMACCEKDELNVWPHHSARHIRDFRRGD
jgi:hypothetical protein